VATSSWPHFFGPPCTHTHTQNFSVGRSPGDFGCFPTASPTYRPHYYWTAPQRRRICNNSNRRMYANIDFPFDFAIFLLPLRSLTSLWAPTFCHFNGRKSLPPTLAFFAVFLSFPCVHSLPRKATPSYDIIYRTSAVCERCYPMYWLLYILDMRFVLFLCTTAVWQFAMYMNEWMNVWMNEPA